ncbi:phosphatidylinositol mannoside acyltransferase [Streptomyces calidiresistens]|uniref:Phosphatidylinositol mannoside acyltransferase n=1 Tax=Streptomyces calidiresistens TaxID=1485586 RepID=A0A7W3T1A6_9ACTN|nr:phosphatidylinositol mannoside acyltransferase [Streptomyces calidiresistens]MBB0229068.1 phosphatidylinositol mannoside acyltransferase [Streptomyces calidiresistens]
MRERLTDAGYALAWTAVRRMPERAADALGRRVADATWRRRGPAVLQLEANLARVVPDAGPERLRELSREGMRSYLRYWTESFRLPVWSPERIERGVRVEGIERVTDALDAGRGVVLALPHLANWDLAGAWAGTVLGVPLTTVAERLRPESLYDRFVAHRESLGMEVLPHTGGAALGVLARRLRAGGLVALVADRDLTGSGAEVEFFGETARFPLGPAKLARQTGADLLSATLWYDGPLLRARIHPAIPVPGPEEAATREEAALVMTRRMAARFEEGIAAHPQDWHMLQPFWPRDRAARTAARHEGKTDT